MDRSVVEDITKMVVSKLNEQKQAGTAKKSPKHRGVKIWSQNGMLSKPVELGDVETTHDTSGEKATFSSFQTKNQTSGVTNQGSATVAETFPRNMHLGSLKNDSVTESNDYLQEMKEQTPARIGVGRAGSRPGTNTWLQFRYDHAAAQDAVSGEVSETLLQSLDFFPVQTMVNDNETYIRRPDYGRRLSDEAKSILKEKCKLQPDVQIIASDGLSSSAVETNLEDVYLSLEQSLKQLGLTTGTPFYIEKGRVAVMDDVGEILQPKAVVLLIGERPGLGSADSLSAYMCYEPRHGIIEADRMVVSNIHSGGIPPVEAGAYLGTVVQRMLKYQASGVSLVEKEG